jgi:cell division septation protein DedD
VGSFLGNDTAAALKDKLVKKGYGAYIVRNEVAGKALFRVRVGNFGSKEEAAQRALTLKSVEGIEGWVTAVTD